MWKKYINLHNSNKHLTALTSMTISQPHANCLQSCYTLSASQVKSSITHVAYSFVRHPKIDWHNVFTRLDAGNSNDTTKGTCTHGNTVVKYN